MRGDFLKKILKYFFGMTTLLFSMLIGVAYLEFLNQEKSYKNLSNLPIYQKTENKNIVRILGDEDQVTGERLESDQYIASDVSLGGSSITVVGNIDEKGPIEISQLRGRIYLSGEDGSINYYLSWQTNKPTFSRIDYKEREELEYKKIEETSHSYNHSIVFSDIDFSSVYEYTIESFDRWGNRGKFGEFVFYTTPPKSSFFDLLENSFQDAFGWTMGR